MGKRSTWNNIAAAAASGLMVAAVFPPIGLGFLVWVALLPLLAALWAIGGKRAGWRGFGLGWLAGTVSCLVQFRWLAVVSPLGTVLLPMYLGVFWGWFGAFAATLGNPWRAAGDAAAGDNKNAAAWRSLRVAVCLGAVWAGLEWLRSWLFTGFGWNGLGVAFHDTPVMAQAADLLGATGLALVPVFFQAVLLQAGGRLRAGRRDGRRDGRRWTLLDIVVAAAAVGLLAGYGVVRITTEHRRESVRLKTLLVQINIPQDAARVMWSALDVHLAYEQETLKALESLAAQGPAHWPDWVMWPESALTGRILRAADGSWETWRENQETIAQVRSAGPFQLLFGSNELEAESTADGQLVMQDQGRVWNSLVVMSPADELQTYRKHHLVIFGETIPFVETIPLLKKIYAQQAGVEYGGSFTPGVTEDPLLIPNASGTVIGAIPTVCFEDTVPRLTRKFVRPGPQVIVNVTNDGWFKESAAAAQHFANARFRAIELRRPMLRCANTGVSAAIDSTGATTHPDTGQPQVLLDTRGCHFTRGSLLTELAIPLRPSFSLYALIGDWGVIALALLGVLWAWLARHESPAPAPATRNPAPTPPSDTIQWAIVAPGKIARKFARDLQVAQGGRLRAVVGRDLGRARAFAAEFGAELCLDDLRALAADPTVDMVYIASPHNAHFAAAKILLEAGKPVLCEKPMTLNAHQARELIGLARSNGVFLMEALWTRFLPVYARVREWLDAGRIGRPQVVSSSFCFAAPRDLTSRLFNPALAGGGLLDLGVYPLALSQWVLGRQPDQVVATASLAETGVDEMLAVSMRYAGGALAQFVCGFNAHCDNTLTIGGEKGFIRIPEYFLAAKHALLDCNGTLETIHQPLRGGGFEYQIEEAMRCVRAGAIESPLMPHADTLATMATMDEIRRQIGLRYPGEMDGLTTQPDAHP